MKLASWIAVIAAAGFAVSWLGSSVAGLNRDLLVLIYGLVVAGLVRAYFQSRNVRFWKSLERRWRDQLRRPGVALGGSLLVAATYHLGYAESTRVCPLSGGQQKGRDS